MPASRHPSLAAGLLAAATIAVAAVAALAGCAGGPGDIPGGAGSPRDGQGTVTATMASATPTDAATPTNSPEPTATDTPTAVPSSTPTAAPSETPTVVNLPYAARQARFAAEQTRFWGLQFSMEFDPLAYLDSITVELPRARGAGFTSVRTTLRWEQVEPANVAPEAFDWKAFDRKLADYSRAGFDVLVSVVEYPRWATEYRCGGSLKPGMEAEWRSFMRAAVARYSQPPYRVVAWEIGNEVDGETVVRDDDFKRPPEWGQGEPTTPDGGCWGGRAAQYKEFLRMAYEETKAVDPGIPVTIGGLAYADVNGWFDMRFLDDLLAAGGGAYFDFLGYHWFANLKDVFPELPTGPQKHQQLADTLRRADVSKPIWLTETYRFTTAGQPESRAQQIDFVTKELVEVVARSDVRRVYWYGWVDFPAEWSTAERGIVTNQRAPKPAFAALAYVVNYTQGVVEDISTDRVTAFRFRPPRGTGHTVIAWSRDGTPARLVVPARSNQPARVTFFPKDMLLAGKCCGRVDVPAADGAYTLDVGGDALFVAIDREAIPGATGGLEGEAGGSVDATGGSAGAAGGTEGEVAPPGGG